MQRIRLMLLTIYMLSPGVLWAQALPGQGNPYQQCFGNIKDILCGFPGFSQLCQAGAAAPVIYNCLISQDPLACLAGTPEPSCDQVRPDSAKQLCKDALAWAKRVKTCADGGLVLQSCVDIICTLSPPPFNSMCNAANAGSQALRNCLDGLINSNNQHFQCLREAGSKPEVCSACQSAAISAAHRRAVQQAFNPCSTEFRQRLQTACQEECTGQVMQSQRNDCRLGAGVPTSAGLERCCQNCVSQCVAGIPCNNTTTTTTRLTTTTTTTTTRPPTTTTTTTTRPVVTYPTCRNQSGTTCYGTTNLPCAPGCTSGSTTNISGMGVCPTQNDSDRCGPAAIWCGSVCPTTTTRRPTTTTTRSQPTTTRSQPTTTRSQPTTTRSQPPPTTRRSGPGGY